MEACFRHRVRNKKGNGDFESHYSDFSYQNLYIKSELQVIKLEIRDIKLQLSVINLEL